MRDVILKKAKKKTSALHYHVLFWILFISYEIILAAAIREKFNHFADYLLHYLLNILLFYTHCYFVLRNRQFDSINTYPSLLAYVLMEIILYYFCSVWINKYLISIGVPVNVPDSSTKLFLLSILYRFIYIAGMSTAFRIALNLIDNRLRLHNYVTQNLIAENERASLRSELVNAELSLLRSQINPHFLFNSLNSIYNRIRKNDPRCADLLLALADLMKYALQPLGAKDEVPVEYELEYISNYLKLQQARYAADIDFRVSVANKELAIIPLLLISFVENIFQHGDLRDKKCRPQIKIMISNGDLVLQTVNYIRPDQRPGNGVGLANTRKRLEGHYKDRYSLVYAARENIFNLELNIMLI